MGNDSKANVIGMMTANECKMLKIENEETVKKEIYRDVAIELVRKYKKEIDETIPIPKDAVTKCHVCAEDPSEMEWELLLCDFCTSGAAHCGCLDPDYSVVPEGKWACKECQNEIIESHKEEYEQMVAVKLNELKNEFKERKEKLKKIKNKNQKKKEAEIKMDIQINTSSLPHIPTQQHFFPTSFCNPSPSSFNAHPQFKQNMISMPSSFSNASQSNANMNVQHIQKDKLQNLLPNIHGNEHHQIKKMRGGSKQIAPYQYENNMNAIFSPSTNMTPQSFGMKAMNAMPITHLHGAATNNNNKNNAFYNPNANAHPHQIFHAQHLHQSHSPHSMMNNQHIPIPNQMNAVNPAMFSDFLSVLNNSNSAKNNTNNAAQNNNSSQSGANIAITNLNVVNIKCDNINNMLSQRQTHSNQSSPNSNPQSIDHRKIT